MPPRLDPLPDDPLKAAPLASADIAAALAAGELTLLYQPQVTPGGVPRGVEALMRWDHPTRGPIEPAAFVPLAEECGLVAALGAFALERACRDGARWDDLFVSVNVSPYQFRDPGFVDSVTRIARDAGMPCERLELEITEGVAFDDLDDAAREIHTLRDCGINVALDDFGTGYAALTCLRRLPVTKVKIDQSFVRDVAHRDSAAIIRAVVTLAHALGLETTAEGVETEEQRAFLQSLGCDYLQGFLFSEAVSSATIAHGVAARRLALG